MRSLFGSVAILMLIGCTESSETPCGSAATEAGRSRSDAGAVADLLPGKPFGWVENDNGKGKLVDIKWTWENPLPQGNRLNDVWGTSLTDVYAVGDHGTILHFDGKMEPATQN